VKIVIDEKASLLKTTHRHLSTLHVTSAKCLMIKCVFDSVLFIAQNTDAIKCLLCSLILISED